MNNIIRAAQRNILEVFSRLSTNFALAGGTALELYYLRHRFSADLDFFSSKYNVKDIDNLVLAFGKYSNQKINLESEFVSEGCALVRFYTMPVKGTNRPLKIDFVEEVLVPNPTIQKIKGVRIYSVKDIYLQKIIAISGVRPEIDKIGRFIIGGRNEARDVFDVYMLSTKVLPLHLFLQNIQPQWKKGMIHWYRTFSRQELKLALLDLDIYDTKFDSRNMILYLENEIKLFLKKVLQK